MTEFAKAAQKNAKPQPEDTTQIQEVDIVSYKPNVEGREWIISDTDLSWISTGCYILGTGGGGSPYGHMLRLREIMNEGGVVRVISPDDLHDDDLVVSWILDCCSSYFRMFQQYGSGSPPPREKISLLLSLRKKQC
jgi:hypothetical protein